MTSSGFQITFVGYCLRLFELIPIRIRIVVTAINMIIPQVKRFFSWLLRAANYDFCPNFNKMVYWLKEPFGWVISAILSLLIIGGARDRAAGLRPCCRVYRIFDIGSRLAMGFHEGYSLLSGVAAGPYAGR